MSCLASSKSAKIWAERIAQCERFNTPVSQFCQSIGCSPTSYTQWKRKLAAKPQTSAFLRIITSEPTMDSIETKLPEAGARRQGTAAYHSPLNSYVALWAFRGVGCAPKPGGLRTNGTDFSLIYPFECILGFAFCSFEGCCFFYKPRGKRTGTLGRFIEAQAC